MALELETEILYEIGLGSRWLFFEGSETSEYIRKEAAKKLPPVIRKYHNQGKEISEPDSNLCGLVREVADRGDKRMNTLKNTWEVASNVIAAHIRTHACTPNVRGKEYARLSKFIRKNYLK